MLNSARIIAFVTAFQVKLCLGTVNLLLPIPETEKLLGKPFDFSDLLVLKIVL